MLVRHSPWRQGIATAALSTLILSAPAQAEPRRFVIDPDHFSIGFLVEHAGYAKTLGMFQHAEGEFVYDEATNELESGRVVVSAGSVFTDHSKRDAHLRSAEFLSVEEHPQVTFVATDFEPSGERTGKLMGDLTLLGTTKPVTLDVTINKIEQYPFSTGLTGGKPYVIGVSARTTIRRSEFGMTYGVEGDLVGDKVPLMFEFEARREPK